MAELLVFRRKEQKYLLNEEQTAAFRSAMEAHMEPDAYATSDIRNIYYDTPDFRLIRRSLEKPVYKEKLRLRSYGTIGPGVDVYLEMKKKYKGIVYKRRVKVSQEQAKAFMERRAPLPKDSQIARELVYFRDYYKTLEPMVYLSYDREAWYDPNDYGFRMTLDRNIRYRTTDLDLAAPVDGIALLPPDISLLEVKASGGIPMWLTEHLSSIRLHKQSFSKYGTAYQQMLEARLSESRGRTYA
jgi:SPX domain protein involved in polyphosphate accumulation